MILNFLYTLQIILALIIILTVFFQKPPEDESKMMGISFSANIRNQKSKINGMKKFIFLSGFLLMINSLAINKIHINEYKKNSLLQDTKNTTKEIE